MISVYIADDEDVVRQGLKKIINWEELGFEFIGEANNGLTAYNEIRQLNPDLILLDIRMPRLQGLDLAQQLREDGFGGRIVILSGYSEFKYAQEAIKLDVDSYLTKPIDEDELLKVVSNVRQILQKKKLHTEHLSYYQEKAKYRIIEEMIHVERKNLASLEYSLGDLNLEADLYQVLIIESEDKSFNAFEELCSALKIPLKSNFIELLKIETYEVILLKGEFVIGRFYALKDRISDKEYLHIFIAAGKAVSGINEIYYSYHEALAIYERRFFFEESKAIASSEDLPPSTALSEKLDGSASRDIGTEFYDLVKLYKLKESREKFQDLHKRLYHSENSVESIKSYLAGMYIFVVNEFKKDYQSSVLKFPTNAEIIQEFHAYEYLNQILEFIQSEFEEMITDIGSFSNNHIVDEITEYIQHHYNEELKLKVLAPKFGYNSSYLGKIFAKKIGESFNDYLHRIRTDKAKTLLLDEKYKVYEVSQIIGYKNVDYFHLKFKNFSGMTPNEFRAENHVSAEEE